MGMPAPSNGYTMPEPTQPSTEEQGMLARGRPRMGVDSELIGRMNFDRLRRFAGPNELAEAAMEYFEWNEQNPMQKAVSYHHKGLIIRDWEAKPRPMTLGRMFAHMNILPDMWNEMRKREETKPVTEFIEQAIYDQKFEAAAVDLMNAGFIARDLGLSEKTQHTVLEPTAAPQVVDTSMVANKVHPDDPDPTGMDDGIFPRPMYSQQQIDAGVPFTPPSKLPETIEHE